MITLLEEEVSGTVHRFLGGALSGWSAVWAH